MIERKAERQFWASHKKLTTQKLRQLIGFYIRIARVVNIQV